MLRFSYLVLLCSLIWFAGCGGSSVSNPGNNTITPATNNVQTITAGGGPANIANGAFTSVTVCSPGSTTNCTTVNGILVDTGSSGLRIISSVLPAGFSLPSQTDSTGNPIAECFQFADGFTWGAVQMADMTVAGEKASSMPVQIINGGFASIPAACLSSGPEEDTVATFGANGVLGVSNFVQDCGPACTTAGGNPGLYYDCPASGCFVITEALAQQVPNPVSLFANDNNGVIVELPSINSGGATNLNGSLVFGIGTQSNNGLGGASILTLDPNGNFTTSFAGQAFTGFVDTGSNGLFFLDSPTTGIPICTDAAAFYCPSGTVNRSATNQGQNGHSTTINFSVANADSELSSSNPNFLFNNLGGPNPGVFDWGLPFFFGRNVFVAIEGKSTPGGAGPYTAY